MIFRTFLTLSLAVTVITPCAHANQPEATQRIVHYEDLDLSTPGGTRLLRHRVAAALEAVCGSYAGTQVAGSEREADDIAQCRKAARAKVDQRVAALKSSAVSSAVSSGVSSRFRVSSAP